MAPTFQGPPFWHPLDKTHIKLLKTPLCFELTNPGLAWEPQHIPFMSLNKSICFSLPVPCFDLPMWPLDHAMYFLQDLWVKTSLSQYLLSSLDELQQLTILHPWTLFNNVNLKNHNTHIQTKQKNTLLDETSEKPYQWDYIDHVPIFHFQKGPDHLH